jgi:NDP-sugar pyrophosphorylase family protein
VQLGVRSCLADIDVVILAGGLGTRLRSVLADKPKVLAPIGRRTFLDILLERLVSFGAKRVILSLGYLADEVIAHLESYRGPLQIVRLAEPQPMGTAGAIRYVLPHIESATILVLNGDSLVGADLCEFVEAHRRARAEGSLLCARVSDAARYGTVLVNSLDRIVSFREKSGERAPGTINAGAYLMNTPLLDRISAASGPSLERDVFQSMPGGTLAAYVGDFAFLDIGVQEDLARAEAFIAALEAR